MCQIWLRSDGRECNHSNAGMTIAKCTKTAASSNDSNHLSRTPAAWFASGTLITGDPIGISGVKYLCVAIRSLVILQNVVASGRMGLRPTAIVTVMVEVKVQIRV